MRLLSYVVDTNVYLYNLDYVKTLDKIIVPIDVIEELDSLKNTDVGFRAREAIRLLKSGLLDTSVYNDSAVITGNQKYSDNYIIAVARDTCSTLVSSDYSMLYKAKELFDIPVIDVSDIHCSYTGVKEIYCSSIDMSNKIKYGEQMSSPNRNVFDLEVNQYLVLYDKDRVDSIDENGDKVYHLYDRVKRWDGSRIVDLNIPSKHFVSYKDVYQFCAMDLLMSASVPIKIISGTWGSGKSYLSTIAGLYGVNNGYYNTLYCLRNPVGYGKNPGSLPGDKYDKTNDFFKPLSDIIMDSGYSVDQLVRDGSLVFEVPYYTKGITVSNSYIIVDEAEDLTVEDLKNLGTRVGDNSSIVFCGDPAQATSHYKRNNGLEYLIKKTIDNKLVGFVQLQKNVRSSVSKVFSLI